LGVRDELTAKESALVEVSAKAEVLVRELLGVREQMAEELLVRENLVASVKTLDRELLLKSDELTVKDAVLVEVSAKADYLFTELAGVRDELTVKDAVLVEVSAKADYLFTELAGVRDELTIRDAELELLQIAQSADRQQIADLEAEFRRKKQHVESLDREIANLAIKAIMYQEITRKCDELLSENKRIQEGLYWTVNDLKTLTESRNYKITRRIRLICAALLRFKVKGISIRGDVLPVYTNPTSYIEGIIQSDFSADRYSSLNKDVELQRINPYSHFLALGEKEKRPIR
jgi:chromosome segregation ATPase